MRQGVDIASSPGPILIAGHKIVPPTLNIKIGPGDEARC